MYIFAELIDKGVSGCSSVEVTDGRKLGHFSALEKATCHSVTASVFGSFARHSEAFSVLSQDS